MQLELEALKQKMEGALKWDSVHKTLFATDASVYKIDPLAVAFPKNKADLKELIIFADTHRISLIPRTAGTLSIGA